MRMLSPPSMTGCCLGEVDDPRGYLFDSRDTKRATAIAATAEDYDVHFTQVKSKRVWARWVDRQESWELEGGRRWLDYWLDEHGDWTGPLIWRPDEDLIVLPFARNPEGIPQVPDEPPEDWQPDEYDTAWTICSSGDGRAVKCYLCEVEN